MRADVKPEKAADGEAPAEAAPAPEKRPKASGAKPARHSDT